MEEARWQGKVARQGGKREARHGCKARWPRVMGLDGGPNEQGCEANLKPRSPFSSKVSPGDVRERGSLEQQEYARSQQHGR